MVKLIIGVIASFFVVSSSRVYSQCWEQDRRWQTHKICSQRPMCRARWGAVGSNRLIPVFVRFLKSLTLDGFRLEN